MQIRAQRIKTNLQSFEVGSFVVLKNGKTIPKADFSGKVIGEAHYSSQLNNLDIKGKLM